LTYAHASRKSSGRRRIHQRAFTRPRRLGWRSRATLAGVVAILFLLASGAVARRFAPASKTSLTRFDVLIVLGSPADSDGNPTPEQLARVTEGVREYERGVAPRLILTGGADRKHFMEARVMARSAEAEGIPEPAIFIEPEARNTIENACYAERIMKAHGWQSAEVVSSAYHLPRASLIFDALPIQWRTHAAPPIEPHSMAYGWAQDALEDMKAARYLFWSRWSEGCAP
jgi:uncharacterized SAM-binding protein YcdF (DUF218 family)